jgi:CheY-like chemotaxis protein
MSGLQGTRILVADDDCVSRNLVGFPLKQAGCEVVDAADGQEAWELLRSAAFDCLVTDEQMPRVTGRELCRLIRSDPQLLHLPIIMVTGKCLEIDPVLFRDQMSVIRVLSKPFNPRELLGIIQDCVGVRYAPEAAIVQSKSLRLVLAEDNYGMAVTFAKLLGRSGHHVTVAHDGLHALQMARAEQPDAALLDIVLPRMDGYEVARQLREDAGCESTWLIAVACNGSEADRERSRRAGFDHHCLKPIDYFMLHTLLGGLDSRKNTMRAQAS